MGVAMYYKIVEEFGPKSGEKWQGYIKWRKLTHLTSFDSIDAILRPDLFTPATEEDFKHCINADYKINLITDLSYAQKIARQFDDADLVGVEIELKEGYVAQSNLLGYDIIDGYGGVSLLTNWGTDDQRIMSSLIMKNGLVHDFNKALEIRNTLRERFPEDAHACACQVWAIYRIRVTGGS